MPAVRRSRRLSRPNPCPNYTEIDDGQWQDHSHLLSTSDGDSQSKQATSEDDSDPPYVDRSFPPPTSKRSHGPRRGEDHVCRPPNAFILFRSHFYEEEQKKDQPERHHREISRLAGIAWRLMSAEEKFPWKLEAQKRKEEHMKKHPGYRYCPDNKVAARPRPNKMPKRLQRKAKLTQTPSPSLMSSLSPMPAILLEDVEDEKADFVPSATPSPAPFQEVVEHPQPLPAQFTPPADHFCVPTEQIPSLDLNDSGSSTFEMANTVHAAATPMTTPEVNGFLNFLHGNEMFLEGSFSQPNNMITNRFPVPVSPTDTSSPMFSTSFHQSSFFMPPQQENNWFEDLDCASWSVDLEAYLFNKSLGPLVQFTNPWEGNELDSFVLNHNN